MQPDQSLRERYVRAAAMAGPPLAATFPSGIVEGYWVSDRRYFFTSDKMDISTGRLRPVPMIADGLSGEVGEIIDAHRLWSLLDDAPGFPVELARYDLADRNTLAITAGIHEITVDLNSTHDCRTAEWPVPSANISPDRSRCILNRDSDLWLLNIASGKYTALSSDGSPNWAYGQQPESGLGALAYRQQPAPIGLWSSDGEWFITHRIDERALPAVPIVQHVPANGQIPVAHHVKYATPTDAIAHANLTAFHVASGRQVNFPDYPLPLWGPSPFDLGRIWFGHQDGEVWAIQIDRFQREACLIRLKLDDGSSEVIIRETVDDGYIDLNASVARKPNVRVLQTGEIIWLSERSGWAHLYLHSGAAGSSLYAITSGDWQVRDIVHVDEKSRSLLLLVGGLDSANDPAQRSLCRINFDGTGFEVIRTELGDIGVAGSLPNRSLVANRHVPANATAFVSGDGRYVAYTATSIDRGNVSALLDLASGSTLPLASASPAQWKIGVRPVSPLAADGKTVLHGALYFPSDFNPEHQYPLIDYIYPGPQSSQRPQVFRSLAASLAFSLAELGFVVLMLDTRGTPYRDRSSRQASYGSLLEPQLSDHAAAVKFLANTLNFIDRSRVGVVGASAGGAAAARALIDYGDVFSVAVAVCGNHDPDTYTASWSDKYRGERRGQSAVQIPTCPLGRLLMIAGDMDDNVLVAQTLGLAAKLIQANQDFDLLIVPNAGHDVMSIGYVQRRIWDYFVRHLQLVEPPSRFSLNFDPAELTTYRRCLARERNL